ncbi:DUF357 domain-containing protein [Cuniculiplasma sp. SKW3]|uniref:DUF357 domain-containing protein n=1 Tax=unclassified Cuniculiplasma TaxID=2619706 RepID=UPI003FCF781B
MDDPLLKRVEKYIEIERKALNEISICVPENSVLYIYAKDSLNMIRAYFDDALYFKEKGDLVNALSALNYSYGWIDSGVRLGVYKTDNDYMKFTFFK